MSSDPVVGVDLSARRSPVDPEAEVLVRAVDVSKKFASYHRRATSLKERLVRRPRGVADTFWALRGVGVDAGAVDEGVAACIDDVGVVAGSAVQGLSLIHI